MRCIISIIFFSVGWRAICNSCVLELIPCSTHFLRSDSGIFRSESVSVTEDRACPIFLGHVLMGVFELSRQAMQSVGFLKRSKVLALNVLNRGAISNVSASSAIFSMQGTSRNPAAREAW